MSNKIESPLVEVNLGELATSKETLSIIEHAFLGYVNIRGKQQNTEFLNAAKTVLGRDLPLQANTFVQAEGYTVLWLGPDEWLVVCQQSESAAAILVNELRVAFGETFAVATDVSGGNTMVEISGVACCDFLAKSSPLDFHSSVFKVGDCAQSLFAHAGGTFYKTSDEPVFKVIFRRSFGDYLGVWMLDAAREFST